MLVTPLPGTYRDNLIRLLRELHTGAGNARSAHRGPLIGYFDWVNGAVRRLHGQISPEDIDRLVLTKGFERLLDASTGSHPAIDDETSATILHGLLNTELDQRITAFEEAYKALDAEIDRWNKDSTFLVFDTTVFINARVKLEDLNIKELIGSDDPSLNLIVPIVVIDELDGLKQHNKPHPRWRASHTLSVLDRVLQDQATLQGDVTVELLHDPPRHVRLPINDNEIIDRTLAITPLTTTPPVLVTYDTGQSMRAREAGIRAIKLDLPVEPEPPYDPLGHRTQRGQQPKRNATAADSNRAGPTDADTA